MRRRFAIAILVAILALLPMGVVAQQVSQDPGTAVIATGSTAPRTLSDRAADRFNLKDFGGAADEITVNDGVIASGTTTLTSASAVFAASDTGKPIIVTGAGAANADLITTIAAFVDSHTVTLADGASTTTPWSGLTQAAVATSQSGAGSYAPGDTITVSGGTLVTTAAVTTIKTTKLVSATVNNAGSGGVNGACTLTGTTGTNSTNGHTFQIAATISGNAISALGAVSLAGSYTTNPTSLAAEPVTSNCSLTGATLVLKMGPEYVLVTTQGHYGAFPANPAATTTSGSGTGATLTSTSVLTGGRVSYGTDNTAAITAAISALDARGGGILVFPPGNILVLGAIEPPFTGASNPAQNPFELAGAGGSVDTYLYNNGVTTAPTGGSVLDLRYTGGDGLHPAKIDSRGGGTLEIDHLTLVDGGTDNFLFLQTTNTALNVHDNQFTGNPTCYESTCTQNAIRLGGITTASSALGSTASTAGFQGYGTQVNHNTFDFLREVVQFGGAANGIFVSYNTVSINCGSSVANGAPYHFYGVANGANGNTIYGGIIEMRGYNYGVLFDSINGANTLNKIDGLGLYDEVMSANTLGGVYWDANSTINSFIPGYIDGIVGLVVAPGPGANNTVLNLQGDSNVYINTTKNFGIGNSAPAERFDLGDGVTGKINMRINAAGSGSGNGPCYKLSYGGTWKGGICGFSNLFGGTFNDGTAIYGFSGIYFDTNNAQVGNIDTGGHWMLNKTGLPTIASGACGTGANGTIAANSKDQHGQINIAGAATTACAVVFATAWSVAPTACTVTPANATAAAVGTTQPYISAIATTGFTLTGAVLASTNWYFTCL